MIPVGTLCYISGDPDVSRRDRPSTLPGRTCEILAVPGVCPRFVCDHVCVVDFGNGEHACINRWSCLRPITPPGAADTTTHHVPIAEVA